MENEELIKNVNIQQLAEEGNRIYGEIKHQYEPQQNGKFLAIEVETRSVYQGDTSSDAVEKARKIHPDKVFFVAKIGFSATEVLAELEAVHFQKSSITKVDFRRF
ncbi:MAG: hypothetical protein AAB567_00385 [Patescibacteria group bacterium]